MTDHFLDLAHVAEIPGACRHDAAGLMRATGANFGNFGPRHALRFVLADLADFRPLRFPELVAAAADGPVGRVILSCANWLNASEQAEAANLDRLRVIEAVDAPLVTFGLGLQAPAGGAAPVLGPNTRRLAAALAARAPLLSVADAATRQALERLGIDNAVVTGCPSNFLSPDPRLGAGIAARARALIAATPAWADLRCHLGEITEHRAATGTVLQETLQLMAEAPAFYVLQGPALLPLILRERDGLPPLYRDHSPFGADRAALRRLLRGRALHFSSVEGWMDFARSCDIALGMRLHGTMVALQAGVPALLLAHDSRTLGLAGHMGIPQLPAERFATARRDGPAWLLEEIARTMESYDARRAALARVMADYLRANGLIPHAALLELAQGAA